MRRAALFVAFVVVMLAVDTVEARWRPFRRRARTNYTYTQNGYMSYGNAVSSWGNNPQEVAQAKANHLAAVGYGYHPGGGFGGGYYEGWGSGATAEAAMWNTCNGSNCMNARGRAQAWSERAGCWFAINIW